MEGKYGGVYTAGGSSSDLAIPGLKHEQANKLRDFVLHGKEEVGDEVISEEVVDEQLTMNDEGTGDDIKLD